MKNLKITLTHPRASDVRKLEKKGLFDGIRNGQDLVEKIIPNLNKLGVKGDTEQGDVGEVIYEAMARAVFRLTEVYHSEHIPSELKKEFAICVDGGSDNGIDFIVKREDGEYWAIQVKLLSQDSLPKSEMDSTFTEAHAFGKRILFVTNCKTVDARGKIAKPHSSFTRQDFENLTEEQVEALINCIKNKSSEAVKRKVYDYMPHQDDECVPEIVKGLKKNGRHTYLAPTGTGKTASAIKVQRELKTKTDLYLAPCIGDCKKWAIELHEQYPEAVIYQINSGGKTAVDDYGDYSRYSGQLNATTSASDVNEQYEKHKGEHQIFVSTYYSAPILRDCKHIKWGLIVADEADVTAGLEGKRDSWVLYDENIEAECKLYTTATGKPTTGENTISMSNRDLYGEQTILTDDEATKRGLMAEVENIIISITNDEVNTAKGFVMADGTPVQVERITQILTYKKIRKNHPDLTKTIVRFNRKNPCESFVSDGPNGLGGHMKGLWLGYVHSGMSPNEQMRVRKDFEETDKPAVLAQCGTLDRCWDCVPADSEIVADNIHSGIIAIQFNGRITRKDPNKPADFKPKSFIPVNWVEPSETQDEALVRTGFERVVNILRSRLDYEGVFDLCRVDYGVEERLEIKGYIRDRFEAGWGVEGLEGLRQDPEAIYNALAEHLLPYYVSEWSQRYEEYYNHVISHGGKIPLEESERKKMFDGYLTLENWGDKQRATKAGTNGCVFRKGQEELLEKIPGWEWVLAEAAKEYKIDLVKAIIKETKQGDVFSSKTKEGRWVSHVRRGVISLSEKQIKRLSEPVFVDGEAIYFNWKDTLGQVVALRVKQYQIFERTWGFDRSQLPKTEINKNPEMKGFMSLHNKLKNGLKDPEGLDSKGKKKLNDNHKKIIKELLKVGIDLKDIVLGEDRLLTHIETLKSFIEENKHCRPQPSTKAKVAYDYVRHGGKLPESEKKELQKIGVEFDNWDDNDWKQIFDVVKQVNDQIPDSEHILDVINYGTTLEELASNYELKDNSPEGFPKNPDGKPLSFYRHLHPNWSGDIGVWLWSHLNQEFPAWKKEELKKIGIDIKEWKKYGKNLVLAYDNGKTFYLSQRDRSWLAQALSLASLYEKQEAEGKPNPKEVSTGHPLQKFATKMRRGVKKYVENNFKIPEEYKKYSRGVDREGRVKLMKRFGIPFVAGLPAHMMRGYDHPNASWTKELDKVLEENLHKTRKEIAKLLGKTTQAIDARMCKLGLKKCKK